MDIAKLGLLRARFWVLVSLTGIAISLGLGAPDARGQTFPARAIKIVVPATAGGALDLISRVLAEKLATDLKQTVFVENKPGANWIIGMQAVVNAPADGCTLLLLSGSGFSINPHLFKNVPPISDFAPVITSTKGTFVLLVNPKLKVRSIPEFVKLLKDQPGKLNHASNSATTKLLSELFKLQAGVNYADIGYRGASQSLNDTLLGTTDFCFVDFGSATSVLDTGSLTALAVTSQDRFPLRPELPSLSEQGFPGFAVDGGTVILAPAKVPKDIVSFLNGAFLKALRAPDVVERFRTIGQTAIGSTPDETGQKLRTEAKLWGDLIRDRNIKIVR